jgi:hypothetical protein
LHGPYTTTQPPAAFTNVVGIRAGAGVDYDLQVYDDFNQSTNLASITFGANVIDFVAVDGNRRTVGDDYFPRAFVFSGSGNYGIELSQPNITLGAGSSSTISLGV